MKSFGFLLGCGIVFAATWLLTERVSVQWGYLYPLGFRCADFSSADYWPLFPWAFLYLFGALLGNHILRDAPRGRRYPAALTALGRYSLSIYLVHQPMLYSLCLLLFSGKSL